MYRAPSACLEACAKPEPCQCQRECDEDWQLPASREWCYTVKCDLEVFDYPPEDFNYHSHSTCHQGCVADWEDAVSDCMDDDQAAFDACSRNGGKDCYDQYRLALANCPSPNHLELESGCVSSCKDEDSDEVKACGKTHQSCIDDCADKAQDKLDDYSDCEWDASLAYGECGSLASKDRADCLKDCASGNAGNGCRAACNDAYEAANMECRAERLSSLRDCQSLYLQYYKYRYTDRCWNDCANQREQCVFGEVYQKDECLLGCVKIRRAAEWECQSATNAKRFEFEEKKSQYYLQQLACGVPITPNPKCFTDSSTAYNKEQSIYGAYPFNEEENECRFRTSLAATSTCAAKCCRGDDDGESPEVANHTCLAAWLKEVANFYKPNVDCLKDCAQDPSSPAWSNCLTRCRKANFERNRSQLFIAFHQCVAAKYAAWLKVKHYFGEKTLVAESKVFSDFIGELCDCGTTHWTWEVSTGQATVNKDAYFACVKAAAWKATEASFKANRKQQFDQDAWTCFLECQRHSFNALWEVVLWIDQHRNNGQEWIQEAQDKIDQAIKDAEDCAQACRDKGALSVRCLPAWGMAFRYANFFLWLDAKWLFPANLSPLYLGQALSTENFSVNDYAIPVFNYYHFEDFLRPYGCFNGIWKFAGESSALPRADGE